MREAVRDKGRIEHMLVEYRRDLSKRSQQQIDFEGETGFRSWNNNLPFPNAAKISLLALSTAEVSNFPWGWTPELLLFSIDDRSIMYVK